MCTFVTSTWIWVLILNVIVLYVNIEREHISTYLWKYLNILVKQCYNQEAQNWVSPNLFLQFGTVKAGRTQLLVIYRP